MITKNRHISMKTKRIIALLMIFSICVLSACGKEEKKKNPKLADDPKRFYETWDEAALKNIDLKKVSGGLTTDFPAELNMETHSGLINPEDFTGPILCYKGDGEGRSYAVNNIYIPDQDKDLYRMNPKLPENKEIIQFTGSAERIQDEYLSDDKLTQLQKKKQNTVFAFVECMGYDSYETFYPIGNSNGEKVYWLSWRVSFYSYPECKLLGWEMAARPYSHPESVSSDSVDLVSNGWRVYLGDGTGSNVDVMDVTMKMIYGDKYK